MDTVIEQVRQSSPESLFHPEDYDGAPKHKCLNVDGTSQGDVINGGVFGCIKQYGDHVIKVPCICVMEKSLDGTDVDRARERHATDGNIKMLAHEGEVYRHLSAPHPGILECLNISEDGIELTYLRRGCLEIYLGKEAEVSLEAKAQWVMELADTLAYVHGMDVLVGDVACRNILISDTEPPSLVLCDFGHAEFTEKPLYYDAHWAPDATVSSEIFKFGHVAYSILTWKKFSVELDWEYPGPYIWPEIDTLPATDTLPCGSLVRRCWTKDDFHDMAEVCREFRAEFKRLGCGAPVGYSGAVGLSARSRQWVQSSLRRFRHGLFAFLLWCRRWLADTAHALRRRLML